MKKQKKVLITGASKGIGKEIARYLLKEDYIVYGTSRNPDDIEEKLHGVNYVKLELSEKQSIENCFKLVGDVDILINNAGQSQLGSVEEVSIKKFEYLYKINLFGMVYLTKLFLPGMRKNRAGTILNIGSLGGSFALPYFSGYCSSKFAVKGYTQSLRYELMPFGIKVVLIEPSDIKTTISPEFITYDDSEYQGIVNRIRSTLWETMDKADSPKVVAKMIVTIIKKKKTSPSYAVGGSAPILVFLRRFLHERLVEKLVRKRYGI